MVWTSHSFFFDNNTYIVHPKDHEQTLWHMTIQFRIQTPVESKQTHLSQSQVPNMISYHKLVFTDKQTTHQSPTAADKKSQEAQIELG